MRLKLRIAADGGLRANNPTASTQRYSSGRASDAKYVAHRSDRRSDPTLPTVPPGHVQNPWAEFLLSLAPPQDASEYPSATSSGRSVPATLEPAAECEI